VLQLPKEIHNELHRDQECEHHQDGLLEVLVAQLDEALALLRV
jgi:soluble cytochrome b562